MKSFPACLLLRRVCVELKIDDTSEDEADGTRFVHLFCLNVKKTPGGSGTHTPEPSKRRRAQKARKHEKCGSSFS